MGSGPEPLTGRGPGESGAPSPGEWDLISKSNPHLATPLPFAVFAATALGQLRSSWVLAPPVRHCAVDAGNQVDGIGEKDTPCHPTVFLVLQNVSEQALERLAARPR